MQAAFLSCSYTERFEGNWREAVGWRQRPVFLGLSTLHEVCNCSWADDCSTQMADYEDGFPGVADLHSCNHTKYDMILYNVQMNINKIAMLGLIVKFLHSPSA